MTSALLIQRGDAHGWHLGLHAGAGTGNTGFSAGASAVRMSGDAEAVRRIGLATIACAATSDDPTHRPAADFRRAALYVAPMARQAPSCPSLVELSQADAPDVASLYARCADYFLLQDGMAPALADAHELFTDVPPGKDVRDQIVLGWRGLDGLYAVAAMLRDYPGDGIFYLGFMIVDPARRGRGLGRSLYAAIENWAAARGAREIRLAVLEANEAGIRFWRSNGFGELRRVGPDRFKLRSHCRIELGRPVGGPP